MAEFIMPNYTNFTIEQKRNIFEIRNRMLPIPINFPLRGRSDKCVCGQKEDMIHLYRCKSWNNEQEIISYERIYSENIDQIRTVYIPFTTNFEKKRKLHRWKRNIEQERKHEEFPPCDPFL